MNFTTNFASWHDFWYMGGHYLYVWSAYGVGVVGIGVTLARPLLARRRFFGEQSQRLRREAGLQWGAAAEPRLWSRMMHPVRRKRLIAVAFLLVGVGVTVMLVMRALNENINLFYPPAEVVSGKAPVGPRIRAGGMVKDGSVQRAADGIEVRFVVTDYQGADFTVTYAGILPDLFREGKGVLATGHLGGDGVFKADEVLAKHDENYMPPEIKGMKKT